MWRPRRFVHRAGRSERAASRRQPVIVPREVLSAKVTQRGSLGLAFLSVLATLGTAIAEPSASGDDGTVALVSRAVSESESGKSIPFFPSASDALGRQGFVRVINRSDEPGEVTIEAIDDAGASYEPLTLAIDAYETVHFNSDDLEDGNAAELESGDAATLDGSLGDGVGKWQLVVESNQPIIVLNLLASPTGHVTNLSSKPAHAPTYGFEFRRGEQGFVADFADYPPDNEEIYELTSDYRQLPDPLESTSALYLSGVNRSDDLFMFFKGQVGGLVPGARHEVSVSAEIATDTPAGCIGVGGAPGESVWIKAGASEVEPLPVLQGSYLRMNIDVGNQSRGGEHAVVLGDMAKLAKLRAVPRMGVEGVARPVDTGGRLGVRRRPGLAVAGYRFGIREPHRGLLHPADGDVHADLTSSGARRGPSTWMANRGRCSGYSSHGSTRHDGLVLGGGSATLGQACGKGLSLFQCASRDTSRNCPPASMR